MWTGRVFAPVYGFTWPFGDYLTEDEGDDLATPETDEGVEVTRFSGSIAYVRTYTGQPGQAADSTLVGALPEWTVAHDLAGISYAAIRARRVAQSDFNTRYPNGREWAYAPVWDGNDRIFDPRSGSYGWTRNAALIIAHELSVYQGHAVDWDRVAIEADASDVLLTDAAGADRPRWHIDTWCEDDEEHGAVLVRMLSACDGYLCERPDGVTDFYVGRYIAPDVTLTDADFIALEISEGADFGAADSFSIRYVEPLQDWQETPSGAFEVAGINSESRDEITVLACSNHNQASRLNKRRARKTHAKYRLRGTVKLGGYNLVGKRFFRFSHSELGIEMTFEIDKLSRGQDRLTFDLEASSVIAEDFDFLAATEEPDRPAYEVLTEDGEPEALTGFSFTGIAGSGGGARVLFEWDEQASGVGQDIQYRAPGAGIADWQNTYVPAGSGTTRVTSQVISGLVDGATYEVQARNRTGSGRVSDWTASLSVLATANPTPPGALDAFTATAGAAQAVIDIEAPDDPNYYTSRIYRADASTDFADAALVRTEYGLPGNADTWTDTGLASGSYTYWAVPINASGVPSAGGGLPANASGPETITII
ncbi:phage tail protein [Pseudooceanicola algae]|uniref:Fibronectin type-III domain-containing protein n=1 Tax=Pseudooceanicola algae TaxID=1537215 RepID=A0A7T1BTD4_9RHOB|nr:phage tail protein [Pseudooceanicola algae]QPM90117.1 hypothetical protein PSAL_013510 [Pseudooceanicola algae]